MFFEERLWALAGLALTMEGDSLVEFESDTLLARWRAGEFHVRSQNAAVLRWRFGATNELIYLVFKEHFLNTMAVTLRVSTRDI